METEYGSVMGEHGRLHNKRVQPIAETFGSD